MAAASSGSVKVVRALLQNGADVNATDLRHNHASHFAAATGHLDVSFETCCFFLFKIEFFTAVVNKIASFAEEWLFIQNYLLFVCFKIYM